MNKEQGSMLTAEEISALLQNIDQSNFTRVMGRNAKSAREWAGVSTEKAMADIFNCKNPTQRNRISEIETGAKNINMFTL